MYKLDNLKQRKFMNSAALAVSTVCAVLGLVILVLILFEVLKNGISAINWELFTRDPVPPMLPEPGGLRNAFVGQALLTGVAMMIGVPLGILGGTFLAEYGRNTKLGNLISTVSDVAVSVPSIVIGTFIYAIMVQPVQGFNGWAGAVALSLIMLPVIIRTTEDMMRLVPWTLREAAFALGAPYYKVIWQIVYRSAAGGILTGILLAVARIAGETAPLLFTSFNSSFFQINMNEPIPSLTVSIYQYAASPYDNWVRIAWAAAFVITFAILILNITGRLLVRYKVKK